MRNIPAGLDKKANPALTLHEHMMSIFNMKQARTEVDDDYLNSFN